MLSDFHSDDASSAGLHSGTRRNIRRVPSPLNGEKVAEGRMRGGHASDFGS
jgi:hypothetical protein